MSDNPVEEDQQLGIPAERLESFRFPQDSPRTPSRAPPRALSRRASMVTFRKQLTEVPTKSATADGQLTTNLSLSGNPSPPASILESSSLLSPRPAPTVSTTAAVEEPSSGPSEKVDKEPVVVLPPSAVASNTPTSSRNGDGLQEQPTSPPPQQQQSLPLKESNTAAQTADHDASSSASHTPRLPVPVATPSPPPPPPPSSGTPAEPPLSLSTSIAMPPVPNTSIVSPNLLSSNPSNLVDSMRSGGGGGGDDEQPHSAAAPLSARSLQSSSGNYHLDSSAAYGPILASPTNSVAAESREPSVAAPTANNENLLPPPTKTTMTPPSSASAEGTAAAATAAPTTTVASSSPPLPPRVPRRHASSVILRRSPMVDAAASSDTSSPAAAVTGSSGATVQQQSQSRTASESPSRGRSGEAVSMYHDVPHVVSDSSNTASTLNTAAPSRSSSKSAAQRSAVPIASPSRDDFRFCDPLYVRSLSAASSTPGRFRYEPPAIIAATYQDALGTMIYCLSPQRSAAYVDPLQLQAYQNHHEGALEPVVPEEVKDEDYRTVDGAAPSSSLFLSPDKDAVLRQIPRLHLPSQQPHGHPAQRNHNYSSLQEERSPPLLLTAAGAHASPSPYRSPSEGGGGYARQQSGARDTSSSGPRRTVSPFTDVSFGMGPPPQLTTPVGGTKGSVSPTFRMFKQRERAR